jgi:hypothetical protein
MGVRSKSTPPYLSSKTNALQIFQIIFLERVLNTLKDPKGGSKRLKIPKKS